MHRNKTLLLRETLKADAVLDVLPVECLISHK
jgi:hypothetical protein